MQEYICDKAHRFLHPVINVEHKTSTLSEHGFGKTIVKENPTDWQRFVNREDFIENTFNVCPECHSFKLSVAPEENITSVKSVPLEEVDTYLKEGYKVKEFYAKNCTLIKTASPANPELASHDASITDVNDQ